MPSRKEGTIDYKRNKRGSRDYDVRYYGDEDFLKTSAFEEEKKVLYRRISDLKCRNTFLIISLTVLLIVSFVALTLSVINQVNDTKHQMQIESLREKQNSIKVSTKIVH